MGGACGYQQHMALNLLRVVMCRYQQWTLLWEVDERQEEKEEEEEEEAVWIHREIDSLIYPRKAQRNWRRTTRTKLNQRRKAESTGLCHFNFSQTNLKNI